jgi:hypothetical protein
MNSISPRLSSGDIFQVIGDMKKVEMFKLSDEFVNQYSNKEIKWGPMGEFTYLRTYSRNKEDGTKERLTEDYAPTNGVKGFNANSIHLCYKGGWDGTDTRTDAQKRSLLELVQHYIKLYPNAKVVGHRDLSPDLNGDGKITSNEWVKLCPCFNAIAEYI